MTDAALNHRLPGAAWSLAFPPEAVAHLHGHAQRRRWSKERVGQLYSADLLSSTIHIDAVTTLGSRGSSHAAVRLDMPAVLAERKKMSPPACIVSASGTPIRKPFQCHLWTTLPWLPTTLKQILQCLQGSCSSSLEPPCPRWAPGQGSRWREVIGSRPKRRIAFACKALTVARPRQESRSLIPAPESMGPVFYVLPTSSYPSSTGAGISSRRKRAG